MSDVSQGPGWWQASDGKWYAPELHPDYQPPTQAFEPTSEPEPTQATPVAPEPEPTQAMPFAAPIEPTQAIPTPLPAGPPVGPPPGPAGPVGPPPGTGGGKGKLIAALVVVIAIVAGLLIFLLNRDDDKKLATSSSSSSSSAASSSSSQSSSSRSSSSRSSSSRSSSSVNSSSVLSSASAAAKEALLTPDEVATGFNAQNYTPTKGDPTLCGEPSPDDTVDPSVLVGTRMINADGLAVIEEIRVYNNATDAKKAYALAKAAVNCTEASDGSSTSAVGTPTDVTSDIGADEGFAFEVTSDEGQTAIITARQGPYVAVLQFAAPTGTDTSVVDTQAVCQTAVKKLK